LFVFYRNFKQELEATYLKYEKRRAEGERLKKSKATFLFFTPLLRAVVFINQT